MARNVDAAEIEKGTFVSSTALSFRVSIYPSPHHADRLRAEPLAPSGEFFPTLVLNRRPRFFAPSLAAPPRLGCNFQDDPARRFLIRRGRWALGVRRFPMPTHQLPDVH